MFHIYFIYSFVQQTISDCCTSTHGWKYIRSVPQNSHTSPIVVYVPSPYVPPCLLESRVWDLIHSGYAGPAMGWGCHTYSEFAEMNEWLCFWEIPLRPCHFSKITFFELYLRRLFSFSALEEPNRGRICLIYRGLYIHRKCLTHISEPLTTMRMWPYLSFGVRVSYIVHLFQYYLSCPALWFAKLIIVALKTNFSANSLPSFQFTYKVFDSWKEN